MSTAWHVDEALLRDWVDGRSGQVASASVEQHLVRCERCRRSVAGLWDDEVSDGVAASAALPDLDAVWTAVRDEIEAPRVSWLQRLLVRLGLPPADAMLVVAAPVVRGAWIVSLTLVAGFAVLATMLGHGLATSLFLLAAPLVPVVAVGFSYGPEIDPSYEQQVATPYSAVRLLLLRATAVLAVAVPALALAGWLLPHPVPFWWLLPAAAFTTATLSASTWTTGPRAAAVVAGLWVLVVARVSYKGSALVLLETPLLGAYAAAAAVGLALFVVRSRRLTRLGSLR
jgi:hypothetical protein